MTGLAPRTPFAMGRRSATRQNAGQLVVGAADFYEMVLKFAAEYGII